MRNESVIIDNPCNNGEKNRRVVRNVLSYLLNDFIIIIFGLIIPRLYLVNFGSEVNGLVNTVKQIIFYMALLEAGVGAASQQALYGPVASNNRSEINSILSATNHYYIRTGTVYVILALAFAVIYPLCISTGLSYTTVSVIILLYAMPETLRFLIQGKYRILMEVEGKAYVLTNLSTVMLFVSNAVRLAMLLFTDNLLVIQATYCLPSVVQLVVVVAYIKKRYPWINLRTTPNLKALAQKNSVLVHQISGVVFSNTDTIVISIICGLKQASVYAIYMLFYNNIEKIIRAFTDGMNFRMGQMFHVDREKFIKFYNVYEALYFMVVFIFYTVITAFLLPIITLYTIGINDTQYIKPVLLVLFTATNLLLNAKAPASQVINYSGKFNETRHHAIIEMCINIGVSIVATLYFGIEGCLIGTITALIYRCIALINFTAKKVLNRSCIITYRRFFINTVVSCAVIWIIGIQGCEPAGYAHICLCALKNSLWIAAAFLLVNVVFEWKAFKQLPDFIRKVIKKEKKAIS